MKILKTIVTNGDTVFPIDTIYYEESLWLVPQWISSPDGKCLMPDRMIQIDGHLVKKFDLHEPWHYRLLDPVPQSLLSGPLRSSELSGFVVIERPGHIAGNVGLE